MRLRILFLIAAILTFGFVKGQNTITSAGLIPKPVLMENNLGAFELSNKTTIYYTDNNEELKKVALYFKNLIKPATGFDIAVKPLSKETTRHSITFEIIENPELGTEGYKLKIYPQVITLSANTPEGIFRGIQTIRQLLPAKVEKKTVQKGPWKIPDGEITDFPSYRYRGMMLDVSRHFFGVEDVKHLIDLISIYKINTLHLHLSDDQGWRIEIKSWPKLTEIGGKTQVGGGKGGFFTQEDYKEIVRYAAERYITVIPEIDMPGHINAALASYPELNCDNKAKELYTGTDVGFSTLCVHKDVTYKFVDDVIRELSAITPGEYIHIGGDESHATKKEDYIYFISKVQDIVAKYGKKVLGWDEIALSEIKPGTVAEYWAKDSNAVLAVKKGGKILMAPGSRTYLDMQYNKKTPLGLHWSGYVNVKKAYDWDPATSVKGIHKKDITGVESPLWTETIKTFDDIEYMVFPRLPGHAEIGWTPAKERSWDDYKKRIAKQASRFKALDINYYKSPLIDWKE